VSEFRFLLRSLAVVGAVVAALALTACGRKGPLDPPPSASATGEPAPQQSGLVAPMVSPIGGGQPASGPAALGPDGRPVAPKGQNRPFVLDGLLN
jgi:predicted small lipoprotein YifL